LEVIHEMNRDAEAQRGIELKPVSRGGADFGLPQIGLQFIAKKVYCIGELVRCVS
jgi:hypothetical protein